MSHIGDLWKLWVYDWTKVPITWTPHPHQAFRLPLRFLFALLGSIIPVGIILIYSGVLAHLYHPSNNLIAHQSVAAHEDREWHYNCVIEDRLHERLADPSRGGVDPQRVVDRLLRRLGAGRLAHVQRAPVGASEGGGHSLLAFEDAA